LAQRNLVTTAAGRRDEKPSGREIERLADRSRD
jgi:hypothetical protein